MNANTLAARETVREIRESLSRQEPTMGQAMLDMLHALDNAYALAYEHNPAEPKDYESIELWARLAADIAGLIQQRQKGTV